MFPYIEAMFLNIRVIFLNIKVISSQIKAMFSHIRPISSDIQSMLRTSLVLRLRFLWRINSDNLILIMIKNHFDYSNYQCNNNLCVQGKSNTFHKFIHCEQG